MSRNAANARHTAGDWELDLTERYYKPCIRMNGIIICYPAHNSHGVAPGEDDANIRLIIAAPKILAACRAVLDVGFWGHDPRGPERFVAQVESVVDQIHSVIAQATGSHLSPANPDGVDLSQVEES